MKKTLFTLLNIVLITSCYNAERNCNNYKIGEFYSKTKINGVILKSEFKRTKTLQIETYNNHIDSSEVRWINDCEAVFKTINPKNMAEQKDIHFKILTTTDSSYTYEYSYVGKTQKEKGTAFKIN